MESSQTSQNKKEKWNFGAEVRVFVSYLFALTCFQFQQISESFNFNTPANPELVFCWT